MTFSDRLRHIMAENEITQCSLATSLCVSQQTISRWVTGKFQPDIDQIITLSKIFNVSTDYLLGRTDIPNIYLDTKKDPSPEDRERAMAAASAALSGDLPTQSMPQDVEALTELIQQIVRQELDTRSTPSDGQ